MPGPAMARAHPDAGEAVLQAGKALKSNILDIAAAILGCDKAVLDVRDNVVCDRATGEAKLPLAEVGRVRHPRLPGALRGARRRKSPVELQRRIARHRRQQHHLH